MERGGTTGSERRKLFVQLPACYLQLFSCQTNTHVTHTHGSHTTDSARAVACCAQLPLLHPPTPHALLPLQTVTRTAHSPTVPSVSLLPPLRVLVVLLNPLLFALLPSHVLSKRRMLRPAAVHCIGVWWGICCCL